MVPAFVCILTAFMLISVPGYSSPQEATSVSSEEHRLIELLQTAYPELPSRALHLEKHPTSSGMSIRVRAVVGEQTPRNIEAAETLLVANVDLDADRGLKGFRAVGNATKWRENSDLVKSLRQGRTEGRNLDEIVERAGVRFTRLDRARLEADAPWRPLERVLGPLTIDSLAPEGLAIDAADSDETYGLRWRVAASGVRPNGQNAKYVLRFEPFTGRLVEVSIR